MKIAYGQAEMAHESQARFTHENPYGKYEFDRTANWAEGVRRPLRPPPAGGANLQQQDVQLADYDWGNFSN